MSCVFTLLVGCGDCGEDASQFDDQLDGASTDGTLPDGAVPDGAAADGTATDGATSDATATDGTSTADGATLGDDDCPNYHKVCGGECVAVNLNPDHCGECGNTCTGDDVCNLGNCVTDCPPGMAQCDGRCVDKDINNNHCGSCGNQCADGKACNFGTCVDAVDVDPSAKTCRGGGPPVNVDFPTRKAEKKCTGSLAKTTFRWGICSCNGLSMQNNLYIDAFDSRLGPHTPGGYGGSLGANGVFQIGKGEIFGSVWTSYSDGSTPSLQTHPRGPGKIFVRQQLHSDGAVQFGTDGAVDGNAWVNGDVTAGGAGPGGPPGGGGGGSVEFEKTLHVPSGANVGNGIQANDVKRQSVDVQTVCKRCKSDRQIPVKQLVEDRSGGNNDNSVIGLDKDALASPGEKTVLKLPCGVYYLSKINVSKPLVITTTGRTALFIDGDVVSNESLKLVPSPRGEFDVFVDGDVELQNQIQIGSTGYPASTRFYVNGRWTFKNDGTIGAYIYAVPGGIFLKNNLVMYGGMYTEKLDTMNNVDVHYDRAVLDADKKCPDPDADDGGQPDAGTTDGGGTADTGGGGTDDAGDDGGSTCSEKDGSCGNDSDCCSPLVCSGGTCEATSCKNLYESCSSDGDCCSGTCASSGDQQLCTAG